MNYRKDLRGKVLSAKPRTKGVTVTLDGEALPIVLVSPSEDFLVEKSAKLNDKEPAAVRMRALAELTCRIVHVPKFDDATEEPVLRDGEMIPDDTLFASGDVELEADIKTLLTAPAGSVLRDIREEVVEFLEELGESGKKKKKSSGSATREDTGDSEPQNSSE